MFKDVLREVVERTDGSIGGLLMGFDADVIGFVPLLGLDPAEFFLLPGLDAGRVVVIFTRR